MWPARCWFFWVLNVPITHKHNVFRFGFETTLILRYHKWFANFPPPNTKRSNRFLTRYLVVSKNKIISLFGLFDHNLLWIHLHGLLFFFLLVFFLFNKKRILAWNLKKTHFSCQENFVFTFQRSGDASTWCRAFVLHQFLELRLRPFIELLLHFSSHHISTPQTSVLKTSDMFRMKLFNNFHLLN